MSSKKKDRIEGFDEIVANAKVRPELLHKKEYGEKIIKSHVNLLTALENRMTTLEEAGIKDGSLEAIELARLDMEYLETENSLYNKKKAYEHYCQRVAENDRWFEVAAAECEANFDNMFKIAEVAAQKNLRLAQQLKDFDRESDDQTAKVSFYYYMMQEVKNAGLLDKAKIEKPEPQAVN